MSLFNDQSHSNQDNTPLAERMRPTSLEEIVGQQEVIGPESPLRTLIESGDLPSMVFWGPPGTGKTTLARIIAKETDAAFVPFSAVTSSVSDVRKAVEEAKFRAENQGTSTILFVDEIHRFNKAQQDAFLPHVEDGTITLIGATTENPSFEINSPLLSRCRVFTLDKLGPDQISDILDRVLTNSDSGYGDKEIHLTESGRKTIIDLSNGDARTALNLLEMTVQSSEPKKAEEESITIDGDFVEQAAQQQTHDYDKQGEKHYNFISAFHKSLRGSDPDAALYWMARMLNGGEDPLYIARRMARMAVEDVGLADPGALRVAIDAREAFEFLGSPEGELALAQAAIYLALCPKSDSAYRAFTKAKKEANNGQQPDVPLHLRNPQTDLMKEQGYGEGYRNPHRDPSATDEQSYLPGSLRGSRFYRPSDAGKEKRLIERFKQWREKERGETDN